MRRTTLCYIEKDNKYLMLHRVKKENDANRDKWLGIGGGFEEGETDEMCLLREVKEETGLTLTSFQKRAVIDFISDQWEDEEMHLYTADKWTGELIECNEGDLEWVPIDSVCSLPIWQGDRIFLELIANGSPYFVLRLEYRGETLARAVLNGNELELKL